MSDQAYLPPHRREEKTNGKEAKLPSRPTYYSRDILKHYGFVTDIGDNQITTLHASAEDLSQLSHLFVIVGGHPLWKTDKIIFVKSNLELLPVDRTEAESRNDSMMEEDIAPDSSAAKGEIDMKVVPHAPLAVFTTGRGSERRPAFQFAGYFNISRISFLKPHSENLERMLYIKFGDRTRRPAQWSKSLMMEWAVIRLEENKTALVEQGPPAIKRDVKGVNELLKEMRLRDSSSN